MADRARHRHGVRGFLGRFHIVGVHAPLGQRVLPDMAIRARRVAQRMGLDVRMAGVGRLHPFIDERIVRAGVALAAPVAKRRSGVDGNRRQRTIAEPWSRHMRETGAMAAFALDVLIAGALGGNVAHQGVARRVPVRADGVARHAGRAGVPARLQIRPGVGMLGRHPLGLLIHVTRSAHRLLGGAVRVPDEVRGRRRGRAEPRLTPIRDLLAGTSGGDHRDDKQRGQPPRNRTIEIFHMYDLRTPLGAWYPGLLVADSSHGADVLLR